MISTVCILNVFSPSVAVGADLRNDITDFLENQRECRVQGSGRSCMEPHYFDIEVAFDSEKEANVILRQLQSTFSDRCGLDIDWI